MLNQLHCWGLQAHHRNLARRESLALLDQATLIKRLKSNPLVEELLILSTCNRFEIYLVSQEPEKVQAQLQTLLPIREELLQYRQGPAVVKHLFEVAAGLNSRVLGEHYILHQLKQAWALARQYQSTGPLLNTLFQKAQHSAKNIRTLWQDQGGLPSYEQSVWQLLNAPAGSSVLLVGLGQLGQGLGRYLQHQPVQLTLCNRSSQKAQDLAAQTQSRWVSWSERLAAAQEADIILVAVSGSRMLFSTQEVTQLMQQPRQLVDLSMPRVLQTPLASAALHPQARLLNLDDIANTVAPEHQRLLQQAQQLIAKAQAEYEAESKRRLAYRLQAA